jgi:citrate synthase
MYLLFPNLDTKKLGLIELCILSHKNAAIANNNISSAVTFAAYEGSNNAIGAICAGLLSTGGIHAPISQARACFKVFSHHRAEGTLDKFAKNLNKGRRIPGLGNSFHKDSIAPEFAQLFAALPDEYGRQIEEFTEFFNSFLERNTDTYLFPNAALLTAVVAEACQLPDGLENWMFITGRSLAWLNHMSTKQ